MRVRSDGTLRIPSMNVLEVILRRLRRKIFIHNVLRIYENNMLAFGLVQMIISKVILGVGGDEYWEIS